LTYQENSKRNLKTVKKKIVKNFLWAIAAAFSCVEKNMTAKRLLAVKNIVYANIAF